MNLTRRERERVDEAQEQATEKMYLWSIRFIALYFAVHIIISLFRNI